MLSSLHRCVSSSLSSRVCLPGRLFSTTKITAFDVRKDDLLILEEGKAEDPNVDLYRVETASFSRRAQGAANMQLQLRHFLRGTKKEVRLGSTEFILKAELDGTKHVSVLYPEGDSVVVMDEAFEQTELPLAMLGEAGRFLQDGMQLKVESFQGKPVICTMPEKATFEVQEMAAFEQKEDKGAREVTAVLSNGVKVKVPKHCKVGDKVTVFTATGEYQGKGS